MGRGDVTARRVERRRRAVAALVSVSLVVVAAWAALFRGPGDVQAVEAARPPAVRPSVVTKPQAPVAEKKGRPSDKARLKLRKVLSGTISPKSVASSGAGYVTAQNMMYRHSVTVYDGRTLKLVKTISDAVNHESGTVTKLRTSDLKPLQTIDACDPIGITSDRPTRRVWVACYTGTIRVYDDW